MAETNGKGLKDFFKEKFDAASPRLKKTGTTIANKLGNTGGRVMDSIDDIVANTGYSKTRGLSLGSKGIGKNIGMIGSGIGAGVNALQGLGAMGDISDLNSSNEDLINAIASSAAGNPLLSSFLTSDDLKTIGQIQRGSYDGDVGFEDYTSDIGNLLSGVGSGVLMGIPGGIPGMVLGGLSGLFKSGTDNASSEALRRQDTLNALYQRMMDAEAQYKQMKRPNFTGLGIQSRYQDMYS